MRGGGAGCAIPMPPCKLLNPSLGCAGVRVRILCAPGSGRDLPLSRRVSSHCCWRLCATDPQWDWKQGWAHWELALRDTERVGLHRSHLETSLRDFTFTDLRRICLSGDALCLVF